LALGQSLHLGDDDSAVVVGGVGLIERTQGAAFLLVGQVAVRICGGGPDDRHVDLDRGIEQVVIAGDLHRLDEVLGDAVHLGALEPGIGVGSQADFGQYPWLPGRGRPVHLKQHAGRDVEGLDLVGVDQLAN
jgi:hypothetical protein